MSQDHRRHRADAQPVGRCSVTCRAGRWSRAPLGGLKHLCHRELCLRELDGDRLLSATIDMSYVNVQYNMQNC
jgi:hypothetical protein